MVAILLYQFEPEADPENGDEESQSEPHHTGLFCPLYISISICCYLKMLLLLASF